LEVGDGAFGQDNVSPGEFLVDFGDAAVVDMAQGAHQGEDVQAELVARQREPTFGLGSEG
jgi:hypothetical protein